MTVETIEPRAWVGCLACYNDGRLVGAWMDGAEAADRDAFEAAVMDLGAGEPASGHSAEHEELWVMDFEGYGGLLTGECSPVEAARIAEAIEEIEAAGHPVGAVGAYLSNIGERIGEEGWAEHSEGFEEAYRGQYRSETDYAEETAEELGAIPDDARWPLTCIDWEQAWRELSFDGYWSAETGAPDFERWIFSE